MKKIVATVLAMVMALALCTTAFAGDPTYTKAYDEKGNLLGEATYVVSTDIAEKYNKTTGAGEVKTFLVSGTVGEYAVHYVDATAADYDLKLTSDGRATRYLSKVFFGGVYNCKAVAFNAVGEKCEQLDVDPTGTYYTNDGNFASSDLVVYFEKNTDTPVCNILVGGKLVPVSVVGDEYDLNAHDWKAASYDKEDASKVATFKCEDCGTVATVYKTEDAAEAAGVNTIDVCEGYVIGYNYTAPGAAATTTTTDTTATSPKTFDAGIAMYVGMALTSVAGSAVVIGKKKEF